MRSRRAGSVLLVAGLLAATATPGAASAQTAAGTESWAPPPVQTSPLPDSKGGRPMKPYERSTNCVMRDSSSQNIDLKNKPWGQRYLQVDEVHKLMRSTTGGVGTNVTVAVIDTGVTPHPAFGNRLQSGGDYVKINPPGAGLEDCDGHGTEVAGIIAANPADPTIGFTGMAPNANILSIRQSSQNYTEQKQTSSAAPPPSSGQPSGSGTPPRPGSSTQLPPSQSNGSTGGERTAAGQVGGGTGRQLDEAGKAGDLTSLAAAIRLAVDKGAKVINMSVDSCRSNSGGISAGEQQVQTALNYAVTRGVVPVAAAGNISEKCVQNDGDPQKPKSIVTPPWFSDDVLSVAAIDQTGSVASFSVHGPWISVAAPGTEIISLDPAAGSNQLANLTFENGTPTPLQGTSFAAPYVAGLAALVISKYPELSARQVMNRIKTTAQHPAAPDGRDSFVGSGVVNPIAALTASIPSELGMAPARPIQLPSDLPPGNERDMTPVTVALLGTVGGVLALLITLFTVHTVRRQRARSPR